MIVINKNRGWRGLAEVRLINGDITAKMVFSFSPDVWVDMQFGRMVIPRGDEYLVVHFDGTEVLPKGQRSVLIKNFKGTVTEVNIYKKDSWTKDALSKDRGAIMHFLSNKNNHTTSDWNYIGIRVTPTI